MYYHYVTQQRCAARRRRAACRALAAVLTTIERCLLQPDVVSGARLRFGRLARKAKIWRVLPSAVYAGLAFYTPPTQR